MSLALENEAMAVCIREQFRHRAAGKASRDRPQRGYRQPGHVGGRDPLMVNVESMRQLIGEALAQLPTEYRALVCRTFYEGWTTAQIADDLQITESTVKLRLHDAVRALLLTLQERGVT